MAFFQDNEKVRKTNKPEKYQKELYIGDKPKGPGIYKCQSCGYEDVINRECEELPPCSNCKSKGHKNTWKFLVRAEDK